MNNDNNMALNKKLVTLLAKCARSDKKALSDIYKLTAPKIFAVLVRTLGLNATAEQALQDTYTKIWLKSGDYRAELGEPLSWLTSIARSHASGVLHQQHKQQAISATLPTTNSAQKKCASIEFLGRHDNARILEICLNQLDGQPRDCIVRAYTEGLSLVELSELHATTTTNVKSLIRSGLLSLKGCVNGLS